MGKDEEEQRAWDAFAAAAIVGLMSGGGNWEYPADDVAERAFDIACAMTTLRQRIA